MKANIENGYVIGYEEDGFSKVIIPSGTIGIGDKAFEECHLLHEIDLPDTIISIGERAFGNCSSLKNIRIPDSVTTIKSLAFNKSGLIEVEIPNNVVEIEVGVFSECDNLIRVKLPNNVKRISEYLFSNCTKLEGIEIPNGVTTISEGTFYNCKKLKKIHIPDTVTRIGKFAFVNCESLVNVDLPNGLFALDSNSFSGCVNLEEINIPETVRFIYSAAFRSCHKLIVNLPDNFKGDVSESAFYDCREIRFKPYKIFRKFKRYEKLLSVKTIINNYYEDKTYYNEEELADFRKFILEYKNYIWDDVITKCLLEESFLETTKILDFMLELDFDNCIKRIQMLVDIGSQASQAEIVSFLLTYLNDKLSLKMGDNETNYLDELTLEDYTPEELEKMKNNDDEDEMKPGL